MANIDIARALKDRAYFDGLSEQERQQVRAASPVGSAELSEADLESVSGGLEGGDKVAITTTTTRENCTCPDGCRRPPRPRRIRPHLLIAELSFRFFDFSAGAIFSGPCVDAKAVPSTRFFQQYSSKRGGAHEPTRDRHSPAQARRPRR